MNSPQRLVVIGQGYVGLPLSMEAIRAGYQVVGIDLDPRKVELLNSGRSFVEDITDEEVAAGVNAGTYAASTDYAAAAGFDVAVIAVPTPLRDTLPDLSFIEDAATSLAPYVTAGCTVVLESTTYPGTTEELLVPLLAGNTGLTAGEDFFVGYSPERIDPGRKDFTLRTTPKVVSGINEASRAKVKGFYDDVCNTTVPVSTPREAELAKLLENTFRHVNIALVNEMAMFGNLLDINVWEAIDAAATKPFGFMKFTPGPGVGGHCLPIDPSYLSWQVRKTLGESFRFVELANDINEHMPRYVLSRVVEMLNARHRSLGGSKVLVLGISYKKNTGDVRESPALTLINALNSWDAEVLAVDEMVDDFRWPANARKVSLEVGLSEADIVVVATDHDCIDYERVQACGLPVFDTRNRLAPSEDVVLL